MGWRPDSNVAPKNPFNIMSCLLSLSVPANVLGVVNTGPVAAGAAACNSVSMLRLTSGTTIDVSAAFRACACGPEGFHWMVPIDVAKTFVPNVEHSY